MHNVNNKNTHEKHKNMKSTRKQNEGGIPFSQYFIPDCFEVLPGFIPLNPVGTNWPISNKYIENKSDHNYKHNGNKSKTWRLIIYKKNKKMVTIILVIIIMMKMMKR